MQEHMPGNQIQEQRLHDLEADVDDTCGPFPGIWEYGATRKLRQEMRCRDNGWTDSGVKEMEKLVEA